MESYELLIVGGGPAGLAAAAEAAGRGLEVALVDERPSLGGQIFKQPGLVVRERGGARPRPRARTRADRGR